MSTMKVSRKGWVVIPKAIRERHGIKPGDFVHIVDYGGIAIIPATSEPQRKLRGLLKDGPSLTHDLLQERERERAIEERKINRRVSPTEADA